MTGPDLLIVDDCRLYREGLAAIMARQYGAGGIRTAHDTSSMLRALDDRCPDVVLLNLASLDSRALVRAARAHTPESKLVVLGVSEDDEDEIVACAEAGVSGYHLRSGSLEDLVQLISSVVAGESLCSPRVTALLLRRLAVLAAVGREAHSNHGVIGVLGRLARAHLHVVRREDNPNQAWAKSRRQRVVPLDFLAVQAFDVYEFERMRVADAADSDFVFVNLFRGKLGAPMRPDAIGELMAAASRRAGLDVAVRPHQLRHACGSNIVDAGAGIDVVAALLGHAAVGSSRVYLHPDSGRGCGAQPSRAGRGDPVTAAKLADRAAVDQDRGEFPHVLDGFVLIGAAARLAAMLDREFLDEAGWNPRTRVLLLPAGHRLLGRTVCRVEGCHVSSVLHAPDPVGDEQGRDRLCRMPARQARLGDAVRGAALCSQGEINQAVLYATLSVLGTHAAVWVGRD